MSVSVPGTGGAARIADAFAQARGGAPGNGASHGVPGDPTRGRHGAPADPTRGRHGAPADPTRGRHGAPADPHKSPRLAALMPYVMGGFPTLADSVRIGEACVAAGADVIELGMPYSDPLADGPVIHAAGTRALAAGANVAGVLEVARALSESVPVVLMCYANMVYAPGAEAFLERLARAGAAGLIIPDLPFGEAPELLGACDERDLALVPLVAPTTPPERLAAIGARARGFIYTVSVVGTTGERHALPERFAEVVARTKACTEVPVALGFGIGTPEQARQAAEAGADGVIVGTRLVRAADEAVAGGGDPASAVGAVVAGLAAGLEPGR